MLRYRDQFVFEGDALGIVKGVVHRIDTGNAYPVSKHPYRCSLKEKQIIEEQIQDMLARGIIEPIASEWASPVVIVIKRDCTMRFCVDYRGVNHLTKPDNYPLPRLDDSLDMLGNSDTYSTMDACSAYWQIWMDPDSVEKTTFVSHAGTYAFKFMPFGLRNAPATISRAMNKIMSQENRKICNVYLDDCITFSKGFDQHMDRFQTVLARMEEANLKLKPSKCFFVQESVSFLGHKVSANGIEPDPERVKPLLNYPVPRNITDVRSFLGFTGFYRRFIEGYAKIAKPLYQLLKKDQPVEWTNACQLAFQTLIDATVKAPVLAHYNHEERFVLRTDASALGIAGILYTCPVERNDKGEVIKVLRKEARLFACVSRTVTEEESRFSASNLECLAIIYSIDKFRSYLYGQRFIIETDHCALFFAQDQRPDSPVVPLVNPDPSL